MSDEHFMNLAIKEAQNSKEPLKCGVVITKDGKVLAKTFNSQRTDNDATAHGEIKAITKAGKKLGNKNLTGCIAYCTCEPCTMCLSALVFAKVEKLIFGMSLKDARSVIDISIDEFMDRSGYKFELIKNFMEVECKRLL